MAKPLRDVAPKGVKKSKTGPADISDLVPDSASGNVDFAKKHKIEKHEDRAGNGDEVYNGKTKQVDMTKHGYKAPADKKIYEAKCNMTEAGTMCEVHGNKDCSSDKVPEAGVGKRGMLADKKKLDEVLTKKTPVSNVIDGFVHSKNKMFKGDSKNQRIKRALGAFYDKHPEKSVKEDLAMPMLEGGKKKKTQKESAPGDTPMRFPSGNVGDSDTGRI